METQKPALKAICLFFKLIVRPIHVMTSSYVDTDEQTWVSCVIIQRIGLVYASVILIRPSLLGQVLVHFCDEQDFVSQIAVDL